MIARGCGGEYIPVSDSEAGSDSDGRRSRTRSRDSFGRRKGGPRRGSSASDLQTLCRCSACQVGSSQADEGAKRHDEGSATDQLLNHARAFHEHDPATSGKTLQMRRTRASSTDADISAGPSVDGSNSNSAGSGQQDRPVIVTYTSLSALQAPEDVLSSVSSSSDETGSVADSECSESSLFPTTKTNSRGHIQYWQGLLLLLVCYQLLYTSGTYACSFDISRTGHKVAAIVTFFGVMGSRATVATLAVWRSARFSKSNRNLQVSLFGAYSGQAPDHSKSLKYLQWMLGVFVIGGPAALTAVRTALKDATFRSRNLYSCDMGGLQSMSAHFRCAPCRVVLRGAG